jgi:hypothetical protein
MDVFDGFGMEGKKIRYDELFINVPRLLRMLTHVERSNTNVSCYLMLLKR